MNWLSDVFKYEEVVSLCLGALQRGLEAYAGESWQEGGLLPKPGSRNQGKGQWHVVEATRSDKGEL